MIVVGISFEWNGYMRKRAFCRGLILFVSLFLLECGLLVGSQVTVNTPVTQNNVVCTIEKSETDKCITYFKFNKTQEVFVYKIYKGTDKTTSYIINEAVPGAKQIFQPIKLKDNALAFLCTIYEAQGKQAASSCRAESQ